MDDAISIEINDKGNYVIGVHIADVSHYIRPNTPLFNEAMQRGNSLYMLNTVIPMLMHKLSNGICSLNPNVDRLAISCIMEITPNGKIVSHDIFESIIRSRIQMTYKKVNKILNDENSKIYPYTSRVLFLQDGSVICDKAQHWGEQISDIPEYADSAKHISRTEMDTDKLNMTIYNFIDYGLQNRHLVQLWTTFALLTLLFISLLMLIFYIMIGKQILHPIEHIAHTMDQSTDNQLGPPLTDIRKNEIGQIEQSYNRMISNIRHLLNENKLQMQKTYEAELKSLELQINPHFIFNTLDTINWTAVQEGAMDVSEMLTGLASILRYTVYGINQVVPLKSDIDWIHRYLELQKIRFHNKFSYDLFIQDPSIDQLRIHKLLLEPILENSLVHGFDGLNRNCHIEIRYQLLKNQFLKITITDNGKGVSEARLQELRTILSSPDWYRIETAKSIGLMNVMCRMHTYYKGSKIMIASNHHTTCFKLFIPLSEME